MFNKKLKERIKELEAENRSLYEKQFRVGDMVFVNDGSFNPMTPVYLRKSYNGTTCYYVTEGKDDAIKETVGHGVNIKNITQQKPKCCKACNNKI